MQMSHRQIAMVVTYTHADAAAEKPLVLTEWLRLTVDTSPVLFPSPKQCFRPLVAVALLFLPLSPLLWPLPSLLPLRRFVQIQMMQMMRVQCPKER